MLGSRGNAAQRKIKGETYRSEWFELSSALYLGARNSSPQIVLIIPFCKLDPNLVIYWAENVIE